MSEIKRPEIKYKKDGEKPRIRRIYRPTPKANAAWIQLKLGEMYYYGIDVEPDHKKALMHFKKALAGGKEEARHFLELLEQAKE